MASAAGAVDRKAADRCPGSVVVHRAQDGFLARVRIPGGRVTAEQLRTLARAAELGNGLIDLTSRANLQLRGLEESAGERLAAILRDVGLLRSVPHDRVRNVIASPLAGRHPRSRGQTDAVVAEIDRELCADPALATLPGRFLFAVDDGSGLALGPRADVALIARDQNAYVLALAGEATADVVDGANAPAAAVAAARAFLAERHERGAEAWRIAELEDGPAAVARRLGTELTGRVAVPDGSRLTPGVLTQRDGRVAVTALARLGRLEGGDLAALARLTNEIRVGTGRTVTILDADPGEARALRAELGSLGLELARESGWVGLTACAGLGRCPKARLDVVGAATVRARVRRPGSPPEHWAACERRCGERAGQPVAVSPAPGQDALVWRIDGTDGLVATVDEALTALGSR